MAFYDVVVLHEDAFEESKGGKDRGTFTVSRTLLAKSDTPHPSFVSIGTSTSTWPGLGGEAIDQINSLRNFDGIVARCSSRRFEWYNGTENGVQISLTYEGLSPYENADGGGSEQPRELESETWRRISISTSQVGVPATDKDGKGFCNAAGDPVDGLEEETAIAIMRYTNEFNPNPALHRIWYWLNKCNSGKFLGAEPYTLRVTGFSADFDDKAMLWNTSLEISYNPKTWAILYYNAGFNKLVPEGFPPTYTRKAILDINGNPVSQPVALNEFGTELDPDLPTPSTGASGQCFKLSEPQSLKAEPYESADFTLMLSDLRMY